MKLISSLSTRLAIASLATVIMAGAAFASGAAAIPPRNDWSFAGPFGKYDETQLQRGFKVFHEVCSNCHSMSKLAFRTLSQEGGPGFSEDQVKALAATYKVKDGPNDNGDYFERPGRPADFWPSPFPNKQAAAAANGGAAPPDFSVIAKARTYERGFPNFVFDIFTQFQEQGVDYISALLHGYEEAPAGFSRLFWRFRIARGDTILVYGTATVRERTPGVDETLAADYYYLGGHIYNITDVERTILINAGYGQYITTI